MDAVLDLIRHYNFWPYNICWGTEKIQLNKTRKLRILLDLFNHKTITKGVA